MDPILTKHLRALGSKGGRARLKKYSKKQLSLQVKRGLRRKRNGGR